MAVTKRLRHEVMRRDNFTCRYCGASAPDAPLTIDHVVPVALGGSDDATNLVTACRDCNAGKSSVPADASLVADVEQDAVRWAAAMKRLAEQDSEARRDQRMALTDFEQYWDEAMPRWAYRGDDWDGSVLRFLRAGLVADDLYEAVEIAARKHGLPNAARWKYFCGTCHGIIRNRMDRAAELVREPAPAPLNVDAESHYAQSVYFYLANTCDGEL